VKHYEVDYLRAIEPKSLKDFISKAVKDLRNKDFDAIVFSGYSGALVAPAVALRLKKHLIVVRKAGTDSHSSQTVEGYRGEKCKYIFLDDFVSLSKTIKRCIKKTRNWVPNSQCVGAYFYKPNHSCFIPTKYWVPIKLLRLKKVI
jgi:orotate phosphoribosyltransferase